MVQNSVPKSVGTVRLTPQGKCDVKIDPLVDPGYFSDQRDWEVYRRGMRFTLEIIKEMAQEGYPIEEALIPSSLSDEDIDEFVRIHGMTSQHYVSSCRMLPLRKGGVVDQQLKVHGIIGLRIADASVFPGMVASRPQATVVMIAERCAEFIQREWTNREKLEDTGSSGDTLAGKC